MKPKKPYRWAALNIVGQVPSWGRHPHRSYTTSSKHQDHLEDLEPSSRVSNRLHVELGLRFCIPQFSSDADAVSTHTEAYVQIFLVSASFV